jgi:hypothetical protein
MAEKHCETCEHHEKHTADIASNKTTLAVAILVVGGLGGLILNGFASTDGEIKEELNRQETEVRQEIKEVKECVAGQTLEITLLRKEVETVAKDTTETKRLLESIISASNIPLIKDRYDGDNRTRK